MEKPLLQNLTLSCDAMTMVKVNFAHVWKKQPNHCTTWYASRDPRGHLRKNLMAMSYFVRYAMSLHGINLTHQVGILEDIMGGYRREIVIHSNKSKIPCTTLSVHG